MSSFGGGRDFNQGVRPALLWSMTGLLCLVLVYSAGALWRAQQFNRAIQSGDLNNAKKFARVPSRKMLSALTADRAGQLVQASEGYSALASTEDQELWAAARFNLAGVYMRQAVALETAEKQDGRPVLIELAKLHYREILQAEFFKESASHNLALALALQPDVLASGPSDMESMPERSPQAPVTSAGRERLP